jgi:hypothetical protein
VPGKFPKIHDSEGQWINSVLTYNHTDTEKLEKEDACKMREIFEMSGSPHVHGFDALTNHCTISIDSNKQYLAGFLPRILRLRE